MVKFNGSTVENSSLCLYISYPKSKRWNLSDISEWDDISSRPYAPSSRRSYQLIQKFILNVSCQTEKSDSLNCSCEWTISTRLIRDNLIDLWLIIDSPEYPTPNNKNDSLEPYDESILSWNFWRLICLFGVIWRKSSNE